jgi:uncharacterized protein YecE (DUF72 family)
MIGCCGWPESKPRYFADFPVVELQDPFYEPPSIALAAKWRNIAPEPFQFCIKAWQLITHPASSPTYRRLKSGLSPTEREFVGLFRPTEQVWLAWERTRDVAKTLRAAVIVFQCPRSFTPERENISNFRRFFTQIRSGAAMPSETLLSWEPRGEWPSGLIRDLCCEFNLLHCVDPFDRPSVWGQSIYWRLHGRGGYSHKYSDSDLIHLTSLLIQSDLTPSEARNQSPGYVLFNNIWMKEDARRFQALLAAETPHSA